LKGWKTKIGKREVVRGKEKFGKKKKKDCEKEIKLVKEICKKENLNTSKRSLKKVFQDKCKLFQNR